MIKYKQKGEIRVFSKNLKYYRLKNQLTKRALAEMVGISPMAVTNYEDGSRNPDIEIVARLANVLGVRVSDFLDQRDENLVFQHGEFRKNASLKVSQQEFIRESVEEYFGRLMTVVEILGGEVLPDALCCHELILSDDDEQNAALLRRYLGFAPDGPIENLIGHLENKGILIYECKIENNKFSGMNGLVNNRPYIIFNPNMSTERNRSTIAHELAHLMFDWPDTMTDNDIEKKANSISGAFLFSKTDAVRELGVRRSSITNAMLIVAKEYGISMMLLAIRAKQCGIINEAAARSFYIKANKLGWRTNEPSRIEAEHPSLFEQLVYRAVNEEEISIQRGAELLQKPYNDILTMSQFSEV
ncbi:MAG: helix-turn-helix domain-containing protein [Firmicutes bacterium]|nr:helix-turn-helix domain-containing protein [Bacillota bacterium]